MKHPSAFPKQQRLKSRSLIARLFKEGKSLSSYPLRVNYLFTDGKADVLQAGFVASVKAFKKAVDRNRIKRLMREAYRLRKNEVEESLQNNRLQAVVFFVYSGREMPDFVLVKTHMHLLLQKLVRSFNEKGSANN